MPGAVGGGPEPGSPEPAGGPLLVCAAGAPAVVPMALVWASVILTGDGGGGGGADGVIGGAPKAIGAILMTRAASVGPSQSSAGTT